MVVNVSGKLVIISILTVALAAAGASWWFRYAATHGAVQFWGPQTAQLIRDAPTVELYRNERLPDSAFKSGFATSYLDVADGNDISRAPGLVHLRNALLEDRSYNWPAEYRRPGSGGWVLVFRNTQQSEVAALFFTSDWRYVDSTGHEYMLSCEPISDGLAKFVAELPSAPAKSAR
jgi:hypothetical protein